MLASSAIGAPTTSIVLSDRPAAKPPTPSRISATAVATKTPQSRPPTRRWRGSGS